MSHTTQAGEFFILHNGDFSGDVTFNVRSGNTAGGDPKYDYVAKLPMWVLEFIVAKKVRDEKISELENAGYEKILGLKHRGSVMD